MQLLNSRKCKQFSKIFSPYLTAADEGITGTSTKNRNGFNEMINAAMHGKIDLIITKEVSRFARNTVDTLQYTRQLRNHGVGVYFINDNINTNDGDGEFRLSIMASVAQEESRKISSRTKWGMQRQMEHGFVFAPPMIGYDYSDGVLTVNEEEAEVVRRIYHMYVYEGLGSVRIAQKLAEVNTPLYKQIKSWSPTLILRILKNEKYAGDLVSKKTVTVDYLSHKAVKNNGIEEKLYFQDHHEPIVSKETWNRAQELCKEKGKNAIENTDPSSRSTRYWCSGKVVCGVCGGAFAAKSKKAQYGTIHAYRCRHTTHLKNADGGCTNKSYIDERVLRACVQYAVSKFISDSDKILHMLESAMGVLQEKIPENYTGEAEKKKINQKKQKLLDLLLDGTITKTDYQNTVEKLERELDDVEKKIESFNSEIERRNNMGSQIVSVLNKAKEYMEQKEATPHMYSRMVDKIVVHPDAHVEIYLDGIEQPFSVGYHRDGRGTQYVVSCYDFEGTI